MCSVRRAHVLVFKGKAEVVEELDRPLCSAAARFPWPHVIRLLSYVRVPRIVQRKISRRALFARDGWRCVYCGSASNRLTLDHVIPRSRGGGSVWENVVTSCAPCNLRKGNRMPHEVQMGFRPPAASPRRRRSSSGSPRRRCRNAGSATSHRTWRCRSRASERRRPLAAFPRQFVVSLPLRPRAGVETPRPPLEGEPVEHGARGDPRAAVDGELSLRERRQRLVPGRVSRTRDPARDRVDRVRLAPVARREPWASRAAGAPSRRSASSGSAIVSSLRGRGSKVRRLDPLRALRERPAPRLEVDHGGAVVAEVAQQPPGAARPPASVP